MFIQGDVIRYDIVDDFGGSVAKKSFWVNPDRGTIMVIRPLSDSEVSAFDVSLL